MARLPQYRFRLAIARFPGGNSEHPDSSGWVIKTMARDITRDSRIIETVPIVISDTPITMTRNMAVKLSIDMEVDYLLMIDSDMSPDLPIRGNKDFWPTCWNLMYQRRVAEIKEIGEDVRTPAYEAASVAGKLHGPFGPFAPATIAAPYCGPPPHEMPYIFRWVNYESETPNANYGLKMFERDQAALMTGVQQVGALPTGLILYDVRLFKALPTPWFYYEWSDKYCLKKASTEDVVQTRNASLAGFPQFVHWDCWAGHVKQKTVGKPQITTLESMQSTFANAVRLGLDSTQRLEQVGPEPVLTKVMEIAKSSAEGTYTPSGGKVVGFYGEPLITEAGGPAGIPEGLQTNMNTQVFPQRADERILNQAPEEDEELEPEQAQV